MGSKKISKYILLGSLTASSFLAGTYFERKNRSQLKKQIYNLPALPIFGTVSAATAFSPAPVESNVSRCSQIMKYGFPGLDNVRSFDDFVLSYDRRNRVAHWVFEHLTVDNVKKNDAVDRSKCEFKPDESIHKFFRSDNSDYKGSGYDRGHLAAAGNHKFSQKHIEQTFFLSNMAPQVGVGFNRHSWNRLEKHVRKLTKVYPNVYCCTGPLYLPRKEANGKNYVKYEVIGANHVAVPTHFYKVVVGETLDGRLEMEAYVMPNQVIDDDVPLTSFQVPPESIERAAGLLFFDNISRNKISKINGKKNL
ncbi:endonuclease G, mitochondrial [Anoplophora glabripennis]|nr:endonuclease G, mitochondrial [Anoplophora glabripennis]